jgi:hypothetical protein
MVANWDILNKEFDDLLERLTDEDWIKWHENIETQKKMDRLDMLLKAELQASKILKSKLKSTSIYSAELSSYNSTDLDDNIIVLSSEFNCIGDCLPSAA